MLVVFGGLPGVGKTTIAASVARQTGASFVRVDAIETGLALAVADPSLAGGTAGYLIGNQIVRSMLLERLNVVVDAVNPVAAARQGWIDLASELDINHLLVEVTCSDLRLHRRRIEDRRADLPRHDMPTWNDVTRLAYEPWPDVDMVVDSAERIDDAIETIATRVSRSGSQRGQ